jgi:ketosteroid isomerase-like protein
MRKVLLLLTCAAAAFFAACNQPATNTANTANTGANNASNTNTAASSAATEAELRKLLDSAAAALSKNDADAMDKIYGENFMLVNLDGSVETRAQRLESIRSGGAKYTSFSYSEPNIRINPEGTGAVIIARANIKGTMRGKAIDGDYRVTQVYSKTKDGWRQVSAQATAIASPAGEGLPTPAPGNGLPTPAKPTGGLPTPEPRATSNGNVSK